MWGFFGSGNTKEDDKKQQQQILDLERKVDDLKDKLLVAESDYLTCKDSIKSYTNIKMWERHIDFDKSDIEMLATKVQKATTKRDKARYEKEINELMRSIEKKETLIRKSKDELRREKGRLWDLERKYLRIKDDLELYQRKLDQVKNC